MKIIKFVVLALMLPMVFILSACGAETENTENSKGYVSISQEEAKEVMDSDPNCLILDVRTQEEYDEKHIPGAILIPDYEIADKGAQLSQSKDQCILVYCRSGRRSKNASEQLAEMGYTNVKEFGGINDWAYETVSE